MTITITHATPADGTFSAGAPGVGKDAWNAGHSVSGLGTVAEVNLSGSQSDVLKGDGTWGVVSGGDPWTYIRLGNDFTTSSGTAVPITGMEFTPSANERYEFYAILLTRTATATVGPRPGLAWPTGMTDGVVTIRQTSSATAVVIGNGNVNAAVLVPVGGVPNTTQSFPAVIEGMAIAGASPSGTIKIQLASETAGTNVTVKAGSYLKYRTVP